MQGAELGGGISIALYIFVPERPIYLAFIEDT